MAIEKRTFELGGITDDTSSTLLVENKLSSRNIAAFLRDYKEETGVDFTVTEIVPESYRLESPDLTLLVSEGQRQVRQGRLNHSWDLGYTDDAIPYSVVIVQVQGQNLNGQIRTLKDMLDSNTQVRLTRYNCMSDEQRAKTDLR